MILTEIIRQFRIALTLIVFFTIVTGILYPAIVTGIAQCFFPWRANGSIITQDNRALGSELIGQSFTDPKYFWGRPSATAPYAYNAEASTGSNAGPMNPDFLAAVKQRMHTLQLADRQNIAAIPVDLLTASASGLDPEISPLAARYQIYRIAKARKLSTVNVQALVESSTKKRFLGVLGEPRLNVLQLNLALDALEKNAHSSKGA
jgi:K+-transporting ATPase ATPase C chain